MIRLPDETLPGTTLKQLKKYQSEIDVLADYAERVTKAKDCFPLRNRASDPAFRVVRQTLTRMCSGSSRCCYCEDSLADEVEHIKPKDLYPELTFAWRNYLYACGPCNGPKNNQFALFSEATGEFVDVTRRRGAQIEPPLPGDLVLIDPRTEDPMRYLELDLRDTFWFLPTRGLSARDRKRAEYTIEVLGLNERDALMEARRTAYGSYRARLVEYRTRRSTGAPNSQLRELICGLKRMDHPTVWKEMQRQHAKIAELSELFSNVPEALGW